MIEIPGSETLVELSRQDVSSLLALTFVLLALGLIISLIVRERANARDSADARAINQANAEEAHDDASQLLELARTVSTVVNANIDTAEAIRKLASETKAGNDLTRKFLETIISQDSQRDKTSRDIAAQAVDIVMNKLAEIESQTKRASDRQQLDAVLKELAEIKRVLTGVKVEKINERNQNNG